MQLEQQLKIFQDNQDEKLDELKKERKDFEKKVESSKRQHEVIANVCRSSKMLTIL
jgi:cell division protein FtsB